MKSWIISRRVVCIINIFCCFLILLSTFGCGGDEETPADNPDPSQEIVGTWELVSIDGRTPKAYFQPALGNEEAEVRSATLKLVFASDGSLFCEASMVMATRRNSTAVIPSFSVDFTTVYHVTLTRNGSYVISDAVIEWISGERAKLDVDVSIETGGIPELEVWEQELKEWGKEAAREWEAKLIQDLELELDTYTFNLEGDRLTWEAELIQDLELEPDTYTFDLEGDRLTLTKEKKVVYRKR